MAAGGLGVKSRTHGCQLFFPAVLFRQWTQRAIIVVVAAVDVVGVAVGAGLRKGMVARRGGGLPSGGREHERPRVDVEGPAHCNQFWGEREKSRSGGGGFYFSV